MKTESVSEFLARGGKITVLPSSKGKMKKSYSESPKKDVSDKVDTSLIPEALKISLGMK